LFQIDTHAGSNIIEVISISSPALTLSGLRGPYEGKLGVVEEGALADLLLVDGDPIKDIHLIDDPAQTDLKSKPTSSRPRSSSTTSRRPR